MICMISVRSSHSWCLNTLKSCICFKISNSICKSIAKTTLNEKINRAFYNTFPRSRSNFYSSTTKEHSNKSSITPFLLADIGEGITEVQILQWFVKEGDQISEFDKIANVQSDKATVEITSPYNGEIVKLYGQSGTMIQVGKPLVDIMTTSHQQSKIKFTDKDEHKTTKDTLATPAVRGLAKDMGVKLDSFVPGSGSDGRIMKHDLNTQKQTSDTEEPFKLVEMTAFQKSMVKSMELSMNIPHFSYSEKVIMDPAIQLRKVLQTETSMTKFSFMPFWIKATSIALKDFPILNASIVEQDGQGTMIKYHNDHNIAIAMDTPQGLAVPIIHKVQCKSIFEIASELDILMEKGKNNTLSKQDICNGTFSLSNIGSIGTGIGAIPVVLSPQVCIGALCRIQQELDLNRNESDNQYKIVSAMTVHWSADHRLIDGATLARFSGKWKILVENPLLLLADMK